jgi:three-Cys-motif partner protein
MKRMIQDSDVKVPAIPLLTTRRMSKGHQFGGEWTDDKLQRLRKYLHAYLSVLKGTKARGFYTTIYVDAFAGTGYRSPTERTDKTQSLFDDEDARRFTKGSAAIALECDPPFDHYVFIERNQDYAAELKRLQVAHATRDIAVHSHDANAFLKKWCIDTDWQRNRAVVFLDPYGMDVEWSTIEQIAKTQAIDLWWLFPPVHRLLPKEGPKTEWAAALTRTFGTEEWKNVFYQKSTRPTLFGNESELERSADSARISNFVVERLQTIFAGVAPSRWSCSTVSELQSICCALHQEIPRVQQLRSRLPMTS